MISQKFYYKNHVEVVEPISSATSCADFQTPKEQIVGRRVIPRFSISSFQTSQNRRSVGNHPAILPSAYPGLIRGYGHEQHGDFQPSNIYYEERTNVVTFIDATDSGLFLLQPYNMLKCGGPLCFGYLIDLLKKISVC